MVSDMILGIGRVCVIKTGNDFGKLCAVVSKPEGNFVEVEGAEVKKRKINIFHLWPLDKTTKDPKSLDKVKL